MKFDVDAALEIANQAVYHTIDRNLTDVEIIVFKGAWAREEYDAIAAKNQYSTSYISQDVAPKLWKILSEALAEKVKKSNFKEALKRHWQLQLNSADNLSIANKSKQQDLESDRQLYKKQIEEEREKNSTLDLYIERPPINYKAWV